MTPFTRIVVLPSYAQGFAFVWEISHGFEDPLPWKFKVEQAQDPDGPWEALSPELINQFAWADMKKRIVSKDLVLFFRVLLNTPEGDYISELKHPYGDFFDRREYLIVRDIMRREVLQQRTLAGVEAQLYIKSASGAKCPHCLDPFTGNISSSDCAYCLGTGRLPPYHGPYPIWATFSVRRRNTELKPDGTGLHQVYSHDIRMVGFPFVKDKDIVIDTAADKRYIVDAVNHETEIRRIPVVQTLHSMELPTSDPRYKIGTDLVGDDGCILP